MGSLCSKPDNSSKGASVVPFASTPATKSTPPFAKSSARDEVQSCTIPGPPSPQHSLLLYGSETCPFTSRVRIALQHKQIPVQVLWMNASTETGRSKQLLAYMLPADGRLPILQHRDHTISGSSDSILDYIEAQFPHPSLLGNSHCKGLRGYVDFVRDTISPLIMDSLYKLDPLSPTQSSSSKQLDSAFSRLDSAMAKYSSKGPYFYGDQFTLVDVYLIPFLLLKQPLARFHGLEISPSYTHLHAYSARMTSFSSYAPVRMDLEMLNASVWDALSRAIATSPLTLMTMLQHQSMLHHFQKLRLAADEVAMAAGGKQAIARIVDPVKGSLSMQIKKLSARYSNLLELMLEHAQMEERVIFPALERADRGMTRSAAESHAKDLPVMNGIKEDFKAVVSLEHGNPAIREALQTVASRLRAFQAQTAAHFQEEERDLFPLLNAAGIGSRQQSSLSLDCVSIMESMHTTMLPFLLSGLQPHQVHQYLTLIQKSEEEDRNATSMKRRMLIVKQGNDNGDGEASFVWNIIKERLPALASLAR